MAAMYHIDPFIVRVHRKMGHAVPFTIPGIKSWDAFIREVEFRPVCMSPNFVMIRVLLQRFAIQEGEILEFPAVYAKHCI